ncbi:MAG TPA: hypothetical protein VGC11_10825 [Acidimicrobiia bacterium]|jgi:hypothetical protein
MPVFVVAFVALMVANLWRLHALPFWDEATGMWFSASALEEMGGDLPRLLSQPGYLDGGPNTHSLTPVTWFTAAILRVAGTSAIPSLHVIHIAIAAVAATALFRFAGRVLPRKLAAVTTVAAFSVPLVFAQTGYMYLEIPSLAAAALALRARQEHREATAAGWAAVAAWVKMSGIAVAAGLVIHSVLVGDRSRRDAIRCARTAIPAIAVVLIPMAVEASGSRFSIEAAGVAFRTSLRAAGYVPDVALLLVAGLIVPLFLRAPGGDGTHSSVRLIWSYTVAVVFVTASVAPFQYVYLPRYYTAVVPLVVVMLVIVLWQHSGVRSAAIGATVIASIGLVNLGGWLYPTLPPNAPWMLERSLEYYPRMRLDVAVADYVATLPPGVVKLISFNEVPLYLHPNLGYVDEPIANTIESPPGWRADGFRESLDPPDEFYIVHTYAVLGGATLEDLWHDLESDAGYTTDVTTFTNGEHTSHVIHVVRVPAEG